MKPSVPRSTTQIKSSDFEAFVSEVAASIWNELIEKPTFTGLKLTDFPDIFEAVGRTLQAYRYKSGDSTARMSFFRNDRLAGDRINRRPAS